jgi:hypothetical protein
MTIKSGLDNDMSIITGCKKLLQQSLLNAIDFIAMHFN